MIRARDAQAALEIVAIAARSEEPTPFPLEVVELLKQLIAADRAGYVEYRDRKPPNGHDVESPRIEVPAGFWQSLGDVVPTWALRDQLGRPSPRVKGLSEVLTRTERRRNPFHRVVSAGQLEVWLPAPEGEARLFFFCRETHRRDFGEREYTLARMLAPQLAEQRARWEREGRTAELSRRELQVLDLVGRGLANREVAAELCIAPGTVRKHLDHVYEKLGVHSRTAAAMSMRRTRVGGAYISG
jgi:DNA-binding CsgD family transcriptional regulator